MNPNLIHEPWIPVFEGDTVREVSLRTALVESHRFLGLALTPATLMVAVFRQVLLPVTLDVVGLPASRQDWDRRRRESKLDEGALDAYFEAYRERFNVFDEVAPFAQVAGLRTPKDEVKPSSLLVPALATGNNVPLFAPRSEADPPTLSWQEAICWTLHTHCWDTAGIKTGAVGDPKVKGGKTTGTPTGPTGSLGVIIPTGRNLYETLLFNTPVVSGGRGAGLATVDQPQWRQPPRTAAWEQRDPQGILDLLTWQARRIRLLPAEDPRSGDTVVREVVVAAGDRLFSTPQEELHTAWARVPKPRPGESSWRPKRHQSGRAIWRGLEGLLAVGTSGSANPVVRTSRLLQQAADLEAAELLEADYPLGIETIGVEYGNQAAVIENTVHDAIPLPLAALRTDWNVGETLERVASDTDALIRALDVLEADLRRAEGGDPLPWDKGQRASERLVQRLDEAARRLLAGLQREPTRVPEANAAWSMVARTAALSTADELLNEITSAAIAGRTTNGRTYRSATAEIHFRAALRKLLPVDSAGDPDQAEQGD